MHPVLRSTLEGLLPDAADENLLGAILLPPDRARQAWAGFVAETPDLTEPFRADRGRRNRLSPLLLAALKRNAIEAPPRLLTVLRTAYMREEMRSEVYGGLVEEVVAALSEAGVSHLVEKGAALARSVYDDPTLRHAHDIDLLVPAAQLETAAGAVRRLGWADAAPLPRGQGVTLAHHTQLPVLLTTRPFRYEPHGLPWSRLWEARVPLRVGQLETWHPSPADHLLHALGHASYCPSRASLVWAVDGTLLAARPAVDWDRLVDGAAQARLTLPVAVMLRWIAEALDASVPPAVLERLDGAAARVGPFERDLALHAVRQGVIRKAWRGGGRRPPIGGRARRLLWELLPSREYLRWAHEVDGDASLATLYLRRPVDKVVAEARWALHRLRHRART